MQDTIARGETMIPRSTLRRAVACFAVLALFVWFVAPNAAAAPSDAFRERFNLPEDPEPLLQRILSADEFKEQPVQNLLERIEEWAQELLLRALEWLVERVPSVGPIRFPGKSTWHVVAGAILVALLVFIIVLAIRVLPFRTKAASMRSESQPSPADVENVEPHSSGDSWDLATRMAEQGDYSASVVYLFRFVLLWLDEQGQLAFHPSKTNRELLAGISKNPSRRQALAEMIPVFDSVRYGGRQCDRPEYERFLALCRSIAEPA